MDPGERDRLSFFCVLSAIWMGASLSLLSIAGEREVFDHESFLYLRTGPYLASKILVFSVMAAAQTMAFVLVLFAVRKYLERDCFGVGRPMLWFLLIFWALEISGIALGLLISAFVGRNKNAANLILPLAMILQMVFSASAAGAIGPVEQSYATFHVHRCAVWPDSWASKWLPYDNGSWRGGTWLSDQALDQFNDTPRDAHAIADRIAKLRAEPDRPADGRPEVGRKRPERAVVRPSAWVSYFLMSRYGDILFRTCLNGAQIPEARQQEFGYGFWIGDAFAGLSIMTIALFGLTYVVLKSQTSGVFAVIRSGA